MAKFDDNYNLCGKPFSSRSPLAVKALSKGRFDEQKLKRQGTKTNNPEEGPKENVEFADSVWYEDKEVHESLSQETVAMSFC